MKQSLILFLTAFLAGSLCALAMPPYALWPILFIGLSMLYIALARTSSWRSALFISYAFAFGYFFFGLMWIGNALLVKGNDYRWAWPLAVCGLPLVLSLFVAIPCALSKKFFDLKTISGFMGFVGLLSAFEWLRGHLFTGFPWNLFGYSWTNTLEIAQLASLGDIYTLTLFTIFWACVIGFYISTASIKDKNIAASIAVISFAGTLIFGYWRLETNPTRYDKNIQIRIIQPNIAQEDKWNARQMPDHFFKHVKLSYPDSSQDAAKQTILIWPETAITSRYIDDPSALGIITQMLDSYQENAYLISGILRQEENRKYYNSVMRIDKSGTVSNIYDKHHLVPFGEYIPFQKWIPIKPIVEFSGFEKGQRPRAFPLAGEHSYMPLICYEIVFPHLARTDLTANIIINVTNDAWYGISAGPHQHFAHAIFRAIETGLPVIRSANTGFSGAIDPLGRTLSKTSLYEEDVRTLSLPLASKTPLESHHFSEFLFAFLVSSLLLISALLRKPTNTSN